MNEHGRDSAPTARVEDAMSAGIDLGFRWSYRHVGLVTCAAMWVLFAFSNHGENAFSIALGATVALITRWIAQRVIGALWHYARPVRALPLMRGGWHERT